MSRVRAQPSPEQWEALRQALLNDRASLVGRIMDAIRGAIPSYRDVGDEALEAGVRTELELILSVAPGGRESVSDRQLAQVAEVGEQRARAGVPIDDVLLAWRQGVQVLLDEGREAAEGLGIGADELLGFVDALLAWSDRAMAVAAAAHRGEELERTRQDQDERGQLVRGLLLGTLAPAAAQARAEAQGIEPGRDYYAIRAPAATDEDRTEVDRALGLHGTVRPLPGISTLVDGDLAGLVRELPRRGPEFPVGVGPARPLERLAESFELATRALSTARAFGLTGPVTIEELGLLPAVLADPAIGEALCRRYLDPLPDASSAEIIASLRTYFDCEMRVDRAAERLFVHPNTLRYRIARFEEATAANLRDPVTAFEVWWSLQYASIR